MRVPASSSSGYYHHFTHHNHCDPHHHYHHHHHHPSFHQPPPPAYCVPPPRPPCCGHTPPPCSTPPPPTINPNLPSICPPYVPNQVQGQIAKDIYWRDLSPGEVPYDAIESVDGKHIGQVHYDSCILPAAVDISSNTAHAERGGIRFIDQNIKVLCSGDPNKFYWEYANFDEVSVDHMQDAVKGGFQDGYNLYIGKGYHEDQWKIGKIVPKQNFLYKGLQICDACGTCVILSKFYILKYKSDTTPNNGAPPNFYWRDYTGDVPYDALKAPEEKYVGQVHYDSCNLPACISPKTNIAVAERAGKQIIQENIKILCSPETDRFYWELVDFNNVTDDDMKNTVKGGYQDGYNLYIGKIWHEGEWKIGKVVPRENMSCKGLQICDRNGQCVIIPVFEILKYM